ncbi:hypothetical protein B0A54_11504 [Friedmanniomyces endolithicus]|uniref:Uncharacterized protein n=1 Tax=Friedmanniomyces endolithicus TaxID=329885 RepID=A0A4U0URC1_9PEZI|nr:hypothetical protein B0A54_11504 [Friedmanniomyces endolithicus]
MAFQAWTYILLFFSIVALNHRYGKSYEDASAATAHRRARTHARMAKTREEEKKADVAAKERRRVKREERRREEERLEGIRGRERRWMYGREGAQ